MPQGGAFIWKCPITGKELKMHYLHGLRDKVHAFAKANQFPYSETEFIHNVCYHTPGDICSEKLRGLGDLIHVVAQPIAKAIDAVAGTDLQNCGGCAQRREQMNKAVPL